MENQEPVQEEAAAQEPIHDPEQAYVPPPEHVPSATFAEAERRQRMAVMASGVALVAAVGLGIGLVQQHRALTAEREAQAKETNLAQRTRAAFKAALDASEGRNKTANAELLASKTDRQAVRDLSTVLAAPMSRIVPFAVAQAGAYRGVVAANSNLHRIVVSVSSLKPIPHIDYEMWLVSGKTPARAAGLLKPGPDEFAIASIDPKLLAVEMPETVAVSIEPQGGKPSPSRLILIGRIATE